MPCFTLPPPQFSNEVPFERFLLSKWEIINQKSKSYFFKELHCLKKLKYNSRMTTFRQRQRHSRQREEGEGEDPLHLRLVFNKIK
jgi:hypothetical protein